jgi:hypothetical protein
LSPLSNHLGRLQKLAIALIRTPQLSIEDLEKGRSLERESPERHHTINCLAKTMMYGLPKPKMLRMPISTPPSAKKLPFFHFDFGPCRTCRPRLSIEDLEKGRWSANLTL